MLTRVHTILFTEACPLECRYCFLKDDDSYGKDRPMTYEEILEAIELYDKTDDPETCVSQLLFTGGEPFLFWEKIKEIIEKYGTRFEYAFNTSGYLFTEEILEFLSHYKVSFVLSVDGNEKLTNYLRPVKSNKYRIGYFKKLKEILPTLLYYFPATPYRIIVNPRYLDLLYQQYLIAEQLGFRYFTFILDFECRPSKTIKGITWNDEHTKMLQEQLDLIVQEIILGFEAGIKKPRVVEIDKVITFLFNQKPFTPDELVCKVFDGRTLYTLSNKEKETYCMGNSYPNRQDAWNTIMNAYNSLEGKCPMDSNCPALEYCATQMCPKDSLDAHGEFFHGEELSCITNRVCYESALKLLSIANEVCPDSMVYIKYLNGFNYPEKQEVLNGNLFPMR